MRASRTDPPLHLLDPDDVSRGALPPALRRHRARAVEVVRWAHAYLCQPHPALGREGPVCPYTEPSLERGLFWLAIHPDPRPSVAEVRALVRRYLERFRELEPTEEREAQLKSILLLFPALSPARAHAVLDVAQAALKPEFVAAGLMIGQFHPGCDEPALWNPGFRPLRSPVPLLAIRHMVRTDAVFLTGDAAWLTAYLRRYGDAVPARLQDAVREAARRLGVQHPAA